MPATSTRSRARLPPICTAIPPSRSIPPRASSAWYYQHLPGDDWDEDYTHERTLFRTSLRPDPKFVKWSNPDIRQGEQRDVAVMVGEGGGVFAIDRENGQFLWATPFPLRNAEFPDLEHRREKPAKPPSTGIWCSRIRARRITPSASTTRAAIGPPRTVRRRIRCTFLITTIAWTWA